jgi:hypothetical protein
MSSRRGVESVAQRAGFSLRGGGALFLIAAIVA